MASIAIVTNSLSGGGAERSMNLIANALHERKLDICLVALNDGPEDLIQLKVPVIEIRRKWRGSLGDSVTSIFRFFSEIRRIRPEVAIINCDLPELFSLFIPMNIKIICVEHTTNPWRGRKYLGRLVRSYLKFRGSIWVRVSDHINPWPKSLKFQETIPNPILLFSEFQPGESLESFQRLVYVGRLSAEKNPKFLIEIGKRLNMDVLFVGDGIQMSELQNQAMNNEVRTEFLGHVLDPWSHIRSDDLLVIPSEYEGDGLVVLEALSRGIPFALSRIPAFLRFNFPDTNYFGSAEEFIERFKLVSNSPELLIPSADLAHSLLSERTLDSVAHKWIRLITRALDSH
jgi:glycosyltransferase involved in cell wall biosynthesis